MIYRPDTERISHYFEANLARQFDAVIHIDATSALSPLRVFPTEAPADLPETYPSSI
ncbi:MAG: erythromycin esterase family protein [Actinomycetota bacterium]